MRSCAAALLGLLLSGCASPMPTPDPHQAWIELDPLPGQWLLADELDRRDLQDSRYFQVSPGAHELRLRYQFERSGGGGLRNDSGGPVWVSCDLALHYAQFEAGRHYRLDSRPAGGYRPLAWLRDAQGRPLARARVLRCSAS